MTKEKTIIETKKPDIEALKKGVSFDRETYQERILRVIIEKNAMDKERQLTEEKKAIDSGIFEIKRDNIALGGDEKMELLNHFEIKISEETDKSRKNIYKKVFHIIEEMAKNVQKDKYYPEEGENSEYELGKINIKGDRNGITISTSNYTKDNVSRIQKRIKTLNNMDENEIKDEYKETIKKPGFSDKGGAGLGMIDIIRKGNGGKLLCKIEKTQDPEIQKISFEITIPFKIEGTIEEGAKNNQKAINV